MTVKDLDWAAAALTWRRESLVEQAPTFWRPAPEAAKNHRAFIEYLLTEAGAKGYRTDGSVLIAAPHPDGWLIDDAYVPGQHWVTGDGQLLWDSFAVDCAGATVRFVCPTYERQKGEFARHIGLELAESWWLMELANSGGGQAGAEIDLPGAAAVTVSAPPIYAPPGPILFLPALADATRALPAAIEQALKLGCAAVVVNQKAGDNASRTHLLKAGFRQHCEYYTGTV